MEKPRTPRTKTENDCLHLYLTQVAHEANNQGLTLQDMVKVIKLLEIRPNKDNLKETFVKPYIQAAFGIDSTKKLDHHQLQDTYDALNKVFSYHWHISLPWPSREALAFETLGEDGNIY